MNPIVFVASLRFSMSCGWPGISRSLSNGVPANQEPTRNWPLFGAAVYEELQRDLEILGSRLINTWEQHRWIANFEYYRELQDYTAESWDETNIHQCAHRGPFVVKGRLSSIKHRWKSHMFAQTKRQALAIGEELKQDATIREQGVIYRKYVPLVTGGSARAALYK